MTTKKIYVTGMGIVSAIGLGVSDTLKSLQDGASGIERVKYLDTTHKDFPVGEVKLSNDLMSEMLDISRSQVSTRTSLMGMLALKEALDTSSLHRREGLKVAFISGTTVGGMDKSEQYYKDFLSNDDKNDYIMSHDCGSCSEMIADYFGGFSFVSSISTACSSAANAVVLGANLIKSGRVDIAIVGGSECITKFHLNGFNTLMILDREPCKPFDASRKGLNLGEGAAYIVLESDISAISRKSDIICQLSGYANTCDAFHQTASSPDGIGAYLSMQKAVLDAGLLVSDIDYINAHGTGTENNDKSEGFAIMRLFGDKIPYVSSTKSFTGHTTSAAGGVESVISILAMKHSMVPMNINYKNQMPELSFEPVKSTLRDKSIQHVLTNSFGFGGNDTSLVFSKIESFR